MVHSSSFVTGRMFSTKLISHIESLTLAKETDITEDKLQEIVDKNTEGKSIGVFGEESKNVNLDIAKEIGII